MAAAALGLLAACSHPAPPPAQPAPQAAEAPVDTTVPLAAPPAVRAVAGSYLLRTDLAQAPARRRGRAAAGGETVLRLSAHDAAHPDQMAGQATQYAASATIPGYANQGRGPAGGATATWWPLAGDSVVIRVVGGRGNRIELRGAVGERRISGEVWFLSIETGNTLQLGTFTATRR